MKILDFFRKQQKLRIDLVKNINKLMKLKQRYNLPIDVRLKKITEKQGMNIFLVDGNKIRKAIDIDFTMGGHGLRYVYIPIDEIWIDSSNENEKEELILHEIFEFNLMKQGMSYDNAHVEASLAEIELRNSKTLSVEQKSLVKVGSH